MTTSDASQSKPDRPKQATAFALTSCPVASVGVNRRQQDTATRLISVGRALPSTQLSTKTELSRMDLDRITQSSSQGPAQSVIGVPQKVAVVLGVGLAPAPFFRRLAAGFAMLAALAERDYKGCDLTERIV